MGPLGKASHSLYPLHCLLGALTHALRMTLCHHLTNQTHTQEVNSQCKTQNMAVRTDSEVKRLIPCNNTPLGITLYFQHTVGHSQQSVSLGTFANLKCSLQ